MNKEDFAKFLSEMGHLTIEQHSKLLDQLHYVYRTNFPNLPDGVYKAIAWRVKQAYQLLSRHWRANLH
jgi:hypothetical protein